jgi:hypothetical protein
MTLTNTLSSLGSALYELPKKAVAYATLSQMGIDKSNCQDTEMAKYRLDLHAENANIDTRNLAEDGLRKYATDGFFEPDNPNTGYSRMESLHQLKGYLESCGVNPNDIDHPISEKTQLAMNYAADFAQEHGRDIPFTGNPILDAALSVSILVGSGIAARYFAAKAGYNLFYKPK